MAVYKRDVDEIRRLRRNTTRKLNRMYQKKRIMSQLVDPRLPIGAELKMTRKQLNDYKKRLRDFNSRSNQYVRGGAGVPISKALWNQFVKERDRANKSLKRYNEKFRDIPSRNGMTIDQYMHMKKPVHPELSDPAANAYYWANESKPTSFGSEKALKNAISMMKKRADPNFMRRQIRASRKVANEMIDRVGDRELSKRFRKLSTEKFDIAWRFTNLASALAAIYDMYTNDLMDKHKVFVDIAYRDLDDVFNYLEGLNVDEGKK